MFVLRNAPSAKPPVLAVRTISVLYATDDAVEQSTNERILWRFSHQTKKFLATPTAWGTSRESNSLVGGRLSCTEHRSIPRAVTMELDRNLWASRLVSRFTSASSTASSVAGWRPPSKPKCEPNVGASCGRMSATGTPPQCVSCCCLFRGLTCPATTMINRIESCCGSCCGRVSDLLVSPMSANVQYDTRPPN